MAWLTPAIARARLAACCLLPEHIHLNVSVPYIEFVEEGRKLKTERSARKIPLVGVSLEAIREFPDGFPRYRKSSATLSATVNKFLRENGKLETPEHTLYSIRHSFEDRMIEADVDERIRRDLFGHRLNRERYGQGASLEKVAATIERFAL